MRRATGRLTTPLRQRSRRVVGAVRLLQLLVVVQVVAFTVSTAGVRDAPGFDVWLDGWLQGSTYVACAVLLALRPALSPVDRRLWWLMAAGLACRSAAFVVFLAHVRRQDPQPFPSVADAGWLAMYVLVGLALIGLARSRFPRVTTVLLLDALIAACAAGALALTTVPDLLRRTDQSGMADAAVLVNALYPIMDAALLLLTLGVLVVFAWRPPPAVWVFALGASMFSVLDVAYLYRVAEGTFRPGTPLSALSVAAVAVIAFSAWAPPGRPKVRTQVVPGLAVPALLALGCLAMLAWAASSPDRALSDGALGLAVVGVLAAVARTVVSFTNLRAAAEDERRAVQQALMERLVRAQDAERARIAADVHDDSVQALAAVDLRLSALKKRLRTAAPDEVGSLDTIITTVHDAATRLRNLLFELETPAIESPLAPALEDAATHVFDDTDITWAVEERGTAALPVGVRVSAYRIAREAMVNARKHAVASRVTLTVDASPDGVLVDVVDDGIGVAAASEQDSGRRRSGVTAMRDRAVASGGWWESRPGPHGVGTAVSFFLPVTTGSDGRDSLAARLSRSGQPEPDRAVPGELESRGIQAAPLP